MTAGSTSNRRCTWFRKLSRMVTCRCTQSISRSCPTLPTTNLVGTSTGEADGPMMGYIVIADKVRLAGNGNLRIGNPDMIALVPPKLPFAD